MAKRPAGLIFAVDERPPAPALALLAIQHIMLMASSLVLPIVLVSEVSGNPAQVRAVVAASMIACGIGTMVQATRFLGIGSGFLKKNAVATASSETIAATRNDARMPAESASVAGAPAANCADCVAAINEISSAVPAAPATCCTEPRIAEPCE